MSEILSLAQKFKTQSEKQAKTIEQEVEIATTQLNSFMTAKLQESETIIKQGMENLDTSNEQLTTMLTTHQTDMSTALDIYMSNVRHHTSTHLNQFAKDLEKTIKDYTTDIAELIKQREDGIEKIIKSEMKKWAIVTGFVAFIILGLGILLGAWMISTFSTPTYIIQQSKTPSQTQQPINYGQK